MAIKSVTVNADRSVTLVDDIGNIISMSSALAGVLQEQLMKRNVMDVIRYTVEDCDGDTLSLGSYDGTTDEFVVEVFETFETEIECGNYPSKDAIEEAVLDLADFYGICIDDD